MFRNLGNGKFEELIEEAGQDSRPIIAAAVAPLAISITMATSTFSS